MSEVAAPRPTDSSAERPVAAASTSARRGLHPIRRAIRYWISRAAVFVVTRSWLRIRFEGRDRLPDGPAIYAFNHLSWADPFVLMAVLPFRPRLSFFGPKEEDMAVGGRNRIMRWTGTTIPYKPGKNDLLEATRRVSALLAAGGVVAIAAEGRIGTDERRVLPLNEGPAYFALRSGVPLVPVAINGTSWLRFGGQARVRVGEPIAVAGRPDRASVAAATDELTRRMALLVADAPVARPPGRFGRWLTELFNEWPEGSRTAAEAATGAAGAAAAATSTTDPAAGDGDPPIGPDGRPETPVAADDTREPTVTG
jgi:1-acyl-sn-glycerol-3-phosphate acyltransferase